MQPWTFIKTTTASPSRSAGDVEDKLQGEEQHREHGAPEHGLGQHHRDQDAAEVQTARHQVSDI